MLRQTVYLRLNADKKKIERCLADVDGNGRARSLSEVDRVGPWTVTDLSMDRCYAPGKSYDHLIKELALLESHQDLEQLLSTDDQMRIGRNLYSALFGDAPFIRERWLHVVPLLRGGGNVDSDAANDNFLDLVCRLPWIFLWKGRQANDGFYVLKGPVFGAVTVDAGGREISDWMSFETKLEPHPSLLMVVPRQYPKEDDTFGEEHVASLRAALQKVYLNHPTRLAEARTFAEFREKMSALRPRIVYFYGHASSDEDDTLFGFDPTPGDPKSAAIDVATIRAEMELAYGGGHAPPVVWINACQGSAAARNSFLRQLSPISAAVVTTRTLAPIPDSRALAERALPLIIIDGRAPHSAIRQALLELKPSFRAARWATTVISAQYDLWSALLPEDRETLDLESTGDFPMRLDRKASLGTLVTSLQNALKTDSNKPAVMIWSGPATHSLRVFARRFADHLVETLQDRSVLEFCPVLELDLPLAAESSSQLAAILASLEGRNIVFDKSRRANFNLVAPAISDKIRDESDLLLFMHGPFTPAHIATVEDYLKTWRALCNQPEMQRHKRRIVLGFSFLLEKTVTTQDFKITEGMTIEPLGSVDLKEMTLHLDAFKGYYNYDPGQIAEAALEYLEGNDYLFRPIHRKLEIRADMVRWSEREKSEGKTDA